jgi:hypothetical protein
MQRRNLEQDVHAPPTPTQEAAFGKAQLAIGADQREYWATQSYEQMAGTFGAQVTRAQLGQLAQDLDRRTSGPTSRTARIATRRSRCR